MSETVKLTGTQGAFTAGDVVTGLSSGASGVVSAVTDAGDLTVSLTTSIAFWPGEAIANESGSFATVLPATEAMPDMDPSTGTDAGSVVDPQVAGSGTDAGTDAPGEQASTIIESIDAAILDAGDVAAYTVNGRTVQLRSLTELISARKYFLAEKAKAQGLRRTRVRFTE